jgi:hypothetical protein
LIHTRWFGSISIHSGNYMQPKLALLELTMLNAESSDAEFDDVVIEGVRRGIPVEVLTRLSELWSQTKLIAGEIVAVGKVIVQKIFEFLLANPNLTIGIAVGAAVTALISSIPLVGSILAPLVATTAILYGAGVGASIDAGDFSGYPFSAAKQLALKFFELLAIIFNSVSEYWVS